MDTNSNIPAEKKVGKPATIFKYEAFSVQSLQNLKAQAIYFGSPLGFNDPYDCALMPRTLSPSISEASALWEYLKLREPKLAQGNRQYNNSNWNEFIQIFKSLARESLIERIDEISSTLGIACFSAINSDLLMWGHYAGKYKGFCLEFKTDAEPFLRLEKVDYVSEIPEIDLAPIWLNQDVKSLIKLFRTKSKVWKYEKEWRIFEPKAGKLVNYSPDTLKSVYFGPDMDDHSLEIVRMILREQNPNVKFWKGKRSKIKFKVLFEELKYTSHSEAKSKRHL
jgi:hypothetical protein